MTTRTVTCSAIAPSAEPTTTPTSSESQSAAARRDERNKVFKRLQLDSVELRAHEEYALALQKFFMARAARMGS